MKNIFSLAIVGFLYLTAARAQKSCGIYSSLSDYRNNKISIAASTLSGKKSLFISDFFLRPVVYLNTDSGKIKIGMDSIYAVRCATGYVFRIWNKQAYKIEESEKLQIYSVEENENIRCRCPRGYRFKTQRAKHYYFSVSDTSPIYRLNSQNIGLAMQLPRALEQKIADSYPNEKAISVQKDAHFIINDFIKTIQ